MAFYKGLAFGLRTVGRMDDLHAGAPEQLQNRKVRFRISDVFVPEPAQILAELHGVDLLAGRVVDFSDRGTEPRVFAVVEVDTLSEAVVVPIAKILDVVE